MNHLSNRKNSFGIVVLGLLLAMAFPATALGQRGKGRGNVGNTRWPARTERQSDYNKKCLKFKNCHDASAGRLDGRGPRGSRVSNILSTRVRHRSRHFEGNDLVLRNRRNREARNNFLRDRGRRVGRRPLDNR